MTTGDYAAAAWVMWTSAATSTTDASATTSATWQNWNDTSDTNASCTADTMGWRAWNNGEMVRVSASKASPEDQAKRSRQAEEERKRKRKAEETAESLLRECLSPQQQAAYDTDKRFHVISQEGNRYEIDCTRRQHNVHRLGANDRKTEELCAYQTGWHPLPDNALAQKLMLESDEGGFRRVANIQALA